MRRVKERKGNSLTVWSTVHSNICLFFCSFWSQLLILHQDWSETSRRLGRFNVYRAAFHTRTDRQLLCVPTLPRPSGGIARGASSPVANILHFYLFFFLSFFFFFYIFYDCAISPIGISGYHPWGKPDATESRYPTYGACWVFECFHNLPNSDMDYGIFNVRVDINACDCTRGFTDTVRESALKVDSRRKIPCHTGESNLRRQRAGPMPDQLSHIPTVRRSGSGALVFHKRS